MATGDTDGDGERDFIPTRAVDEARVRVMSAGVASGTPGCAEPRSTAIVHCGEPAIDVPIGSETVDPAALDAIECAIDLARASTCPIRAPIAAALGALRGGDLSSDPWLLILTEGDDCTLPEGASLEPSDDVHRQCVEAGLLSVSEAAASLTGETALRRIDVIGGVAAPDGACTLAADPSLDPDPAGTPDCSSGTAEAPGPSRLADLACDLEERGVDTELRSICTAGWGEDVARHWTAKNRSVVHLRARLARRAQLARHGSRLRFAG